MSNLLDLAVYAWLIIFAFWGGIKGFTAAALGVASWLGAGFATAQIVDIFGDDIAAEFSAPFLAPAILGLVCFIALLVVFKLIVNMLSDTIKGSVFSSLNRGMGVLGGTVAGATLVSVAYFALASFVPKNQMPKMVGEARTLPLLELGSSWVGALLPHSWSPDSISTELLPPIQRGIGQKGIGNGIGEGIGDGIGENIGRGLGEGIGEALRQNLDNSQNGTKDSSNGLNETDQSPADEKGYDPNQRKQLERLLRQAG